MVNIGQCNHCLKEGKRSTTRIELIHDRICMMVCENGHEYFCAKENSDIEILFNFGVHAVYDGYYRESLTSFYVATERFFESCIRYFLLDCRALYADVNKELGKRSERQYGAFYAMWILKFNEKPKIFSTNDIKSRNNAIHSGHIPSRSEAIKFGNKCLGIINDNLKCIREKDDEFDKMFRVDKELILKSKDKYIDGIKKEFPEYNGKKIVIETLEWDMSILNISRPKEKYVDSIESYIKKIDLYKKFTK